ncbi:MAG: hypothetical protein JST89_19000 [Cyanobacteria bacterium SZAS-4]|nr:hypothetical protein [Cyanobacteria bacterium SZAS-4]
MGELKSDLTVSGTSVKMQDGGDSTPKGAEESGNIKPEQDSEQVSAENSQSDQPEKVYDYYHQHFGVALAAGSQDVRNAEAGSRAAYASTAEVADKPATPTGEKSASWNALKSLIRYQTSTTKEPEPQAPFTTSGDSFEAQWLSKSSDDLPALRADAAPEPEAVRLKWTPMVDNVPETQWSGSEEQQVEVEAESAAHEPEVADAVESAPQVLQGVDTNESAAQEVKPQAAQLSYEEALAATARGEHTAVEVAKSGEEPKPVAKKIFGKPARMVRKPIGRPDFNQDKSYEDALAATARGEKPAVPAPVPSFESSTVMDEMNELLDSVSEPTVSSSDSAQVQDSADVNVAEELAASSAAEDSEEHDATEVRSKFGSLNAFARMQKRTKEQVETKEEQSITGDIPDEVQDEVQARNWDTTPVAEAKPATGDSVMNQWCSTSTGDSIPATGNTNSAAASLLEALNSIPTPSVMKDGPPAQTGGATQSKFSLATPKPAGSESSSLTPDTMRQQASRTSWLKAASEYSSSVIKAVSDQMKMLNQKPKKTTPESPEFRTAELPDQSNEER